MKETACP